MKKSYEKPDLKLVVFCTEVIANSDFVSGNLGTGDSEEGWE